MTEFDPYHKWLGIPPEEQPPHHYRLLSIHLYEPDPDVIDGAADRQMSFLKQCAQGPNVGHSQKLLGEVSAARLCLLKAETKAAYDAELKTKLAARQTPRLDAEPDGSKAQSEVSVSRPKRPTNRQLIDADLASNRELPGKAVRTGGAAHRKQLLLFGGGILGVILLVVLVLGLKPKTGSLVVKTSEPGTEVQVFSDQGQVEVTRAIEKRTVTLAVTSGNHRLKVNKQGFESFSAKFEIEPGGKKTVTVKLVRIKSDTAVALSGDPSPLAETSDVTSSESSTPSTDLADATPPPVDETSNSTDSAEEMPRPDDETPAPAEEKPKDAETPEATQEMKTPVNGPPARKAGKTSPDGYLSLFNGKNLAGWTPHPLFPGKWRVENGVLKGGGTNTSFLCSKRSDFTNFQLRAETRCTAGASGGINCRAQVERSGSFMPGYLAKINASNSLDKHKTGSLYVLQQTRFISGSRIDQSPVADDEWFTLEITVNDNLVMVQVNGQTMADYTDPQRLYTRGHVALQFYAGSGAVEFRKIEVKKLP